MLKIIDKSLEEYFRDTEKNKEDYNIRFFEIGLIIPNGTYIDINHIFGQCLDELEFTETVVEYEKEIIDSGGNNKIGWARGLRLIPKGSYVH
ncbi:hypothetical protein J4404_02110 [Candidatus Woesearchaeota archaeon]|nr:hypothetical protein [Candidatus Woesearchaeota archaeon]